MSSIDWDARAEIEARQNIMGASSFADDIRAEAVRLARWQREQLLTDEVIDRAARALKDHDPDRLTCYDHDTGRCCPAGCHDFPEAKDEHRIRAALDAAVGDPGA